MFKVVNVNILYMMFNIYGRKINFCSFLKRVHGGGYFFLKFTVDLSFNSRRVLAKRSSKDKYTT